MAALRQSAKTASAMKSGMVLLGSLLLGGCSHLGAKPLQALIGSDGVEKVQAVASPYAQMRVRIDDGRPGLMMLASIVQGYEYWLAADGKALWLDDGRVVATEGLPNNLLRTELLSRNKPGTGQPGKDQDVNSASSAVFWESSVTGKAGQIGMVTVYESGRSLPLSVPGGVVLVREYAERIEVPASGASWENRYWRHPASEQVVASSQRIPGTDYRVQISRILVRQDPAEAKVLSATQMKDTRGGTEVGDE